LVLEGKAPANAGTCSDVPIEKTLELAKRLRVQGTPTLIFATGKRIPGGVPGPQLQRLVEEHGTARPS
ncbi:thioredoxin fold domain-containing protein, partial [Cutibacterium acnes subsp. acnes]|nr:thioredoxin fold domain-containing protein [Cutibacterium acnes subsp. acnes]